MRILRWRQTGRANYTAADGDGGRYTIDRWAPSAHSDKVWLINHIPASWPEDESTPPRRVAWVPEPNTSWLLWGGMWTLVWTASAIQHTLKGRRR